MKILYINTCFENIIIKLFKNNKIISEETIVGQKYNSQFIMPTIKKVLDDDMPEEIIVVNGPGSFTGIRLGVTIGKTMAYTLNIPIKTITSLEEMAISLKGEQKVVGLSDGNGYYVGIFDIDNILIGDYHYLNNSDFDSFKEKHNVVTDVTIDYSLIIKMVLNKEAVNPHGVKPIYIKKIGVELD